MALRLIQYGNPCAGNLTSRKYFQEKECLEAEWSNYHTIGFDIRVFKYCLFFSTFTGYFCLNHYITENLFHDVHYRSEQFSGIFIFVYLKNFNIHYLKNNVLLVRPLCFSALQLMQRSFSIVHTQGTHIAEVSCEKLDLDSGGTSMHLLLRWGGGGDMSARSRSNVKLFHTVTSHF